MDRADSNYLWGDKQGYGSEREAKEPPADVTDNATARVAREEATDHPCPPFAVTCGERAKAEDVIIVIIIIIVQHTC